MKSKNLTIKDLYDNTIQVTNLDDAISHAAGGMDITGVYFTPFEIIDGYSRDIKERENEKIPASKYWEDTYIKLLTLKFDDNLYKIEPNVNTSEILFLTRKSDGKCGGGIDKHTNSQKFRVTVNCLYDEDIGSDCMEIGSFIDINLALEALWDKRELAEY